MTILIHNKKQINKTSINENYYLIEIKKLECEKFKENLKYNKKRYENLKILYNENNKDLLQAELNYKLSEIDFEISKINLEIVKHLSR